MAALREIGAETTAALLEKAIGVFAPAGPSPDPSVREQQVSGLSEEVRERLNDLSSPFYDGDDACGRELPFVLRHRDQFLD